MKSKILISIKYKEAAGADKGKEIYRKYTGEASKRIPFLNKIPFSISKAKNPVDIDSLQLLGGFRDFRSLVRNSD